jgi:hypothetical protein
MSFVVMPAFAQIATFSQVSGNTTLKVGSKGQDVSTLQNFMATNKDSYRAGLVTGYFDSVTKNAVIQFQLAYNLMADGIAGPVTNTKVNNIIIAGRGMDLYAPAINNLLVNISGRSINVTFNSNELVKATLLYNTEPLSLRDLGILFRTPTNKGAMVVDDTFSISKQFVVSNLFSNSNYNYTIVVTDTSGNDTVLFPKVFRTGN